MRLLPLVLILWPFSPTPTPEKLVQLGILEEKFSTDFKEYLERAQSSQRGDLIDALRFIELAKRFGKHDAISIRYFKHGEKLKPEAQKKINTELHAYFEKLYQAGLVPKKVYAAVGGRIDRGEFEDKLFFLIELGPEVKYADWLSEANLLEFAGSLLRNDAISEENFKKLSADIRAGKIESEFQIYAYCKYTRSFDLAQYSGDPAIYLKQIYAEVSQIFPELAFSDFEQRIVKDEEQLGPDMVFYKSVISFRAQGRKYVHQSHISPEDLKKPGYYAGKIDEQEFYRIFNKVLIDHASPYRLHLVRALFHSPKNADYQRRFGIIALRKEQTEMFRPTNSFMEISYENFENSVTTQRIHDAITAWKKIGLLKHLSEPEILRATERALLKQNFSLNDVLLQFPLVTCAYGFKLEDPVGEYIDLLNAIVKISRGEVSFHEIVQAPSRKNKTKTIVSFKLRAKQFKVSIDNDERWIDLSRIELLRKVVSEARLPGQLYELYPEDYAGALIYLTPEQYKHLKKNALLSFPSKTSGNASEN